MIAATQTLDSLWAEARGEGGLSRFLALKVHGQIYGIPMGAVLEIVRAQRIRAVPGTAPFIRGVINLRGKVVPVMDARLRLDLPPKAHDERTSIVMMQGGDQVVGLIVDEVREVLSLRNQHIERPAPGENVHHRFISGYGIVDNQVRILLDPHRLLFDGWPAGGAAPDSAA